MKKFFEEGQTMLIMLLLGIQVPIYLLLQHGTIGILLSGFMLLLLTYTLLRGPAAGLFWSLPYLLLLGAVLFSSQLPNNPLSKVPVTLPLPYFMGYGISLICLILIAGYIQEQMSGQKQLTHQLQERIRQFVAVDIETGFDNAERMEWEVEAEMKRIDRYGGAFVLLILQVEYYKEFQKLYGEKEREHLFSSLAYGLQHLVRQTDRKFRYDADSLAVLLTNTAEDSLEIVKEKLETQFKDHQLLSGKQIEMMFQIGHVIYHQNSECSDYGVLIDMVEREMVTYVV